MDSEIDNGIITFVPRHDAEAALYGPGLQRDVRRVRTPAGQCDVEPVGTSGKDAGRRNSPCAPPDFQRIVAGFPLQLSFDDQACRRRARTALRRCIRVAIQPGLRMTDLFADGLRQGVDQDLRMAEPLLVGRPESSGVKNFDGRRQGVAKHRDGGIDVGQVDPDILERGVPGGECRPEGCEVTARIPANSIRTILVSF